MEKSNNDHQLPVIKNGSFVKSPHFCEHTYKASSSPSDDIGNSPQMIRVMRLIKELGFKKSRTTSVVRLWVDKFLENFQTFRSSLEFDIMKCLRAKREVGVWSNQALIKMDGFFVFDLSNDLIFKYVNEQMIEKLLDMGRNLGIVNTNETNLSSDLLMQIFNPLLANLRFMLVQFDNSFNYVKCKQGFNIVFDDENFGFLLITISNTKTIELMQRSQGVYKEFMRHLVGPAIPHFKTDNKISDLLTQLIIKWNHMYYESLDVCLEAVEQLAINNDVKKTNLVATLEHAVDKLKHDTQFQRSHAILFFENKFLSMFSSRTTNHMLIPADLLFLNLYCQSIVMNEQIETTLMFMRSGGNYIPYKINRIAITDELTLLLLSEYGNTVISTNLYESFMILNKIKVLQAQQDLDSLVIETDKLDKCIKSVVETEKKLKNHGPEMEECIKNFQNKYEIFRKKYIEMFKVMDKSKLVKVESYYPCFVEATKEIYKLTYFNEHSRRITLDQERALLNTSAFVKDKIMKIADIIQLKAKNNYALNAYLEDFAGLIYFIFLDRQHGSCIYPDIDKIVNETSLQIKKKVWEMIETGRSYLQNGQTTVIWKDFAFSYHYSLWFEDTNGQTLRPKVQTNNFAARQSTVPGIMSHDFYQKLVETLFPKANNGMNKIKVFEIFTVHLGLVNPHLQLEHSRRLITAIADEMISNNLFDLL